MNLNPNDELQVCSFLSRVHALQRLCSDSDESYPAALLFVPGPDGRYNKGSLNVIKYLLHGATGKYLLDGTLDSSCDPLEDIILLVQQSSISVFWSAAAKAIIGPLLSKVPILIEYCPTNEEEEEVDKFQERKCVDFKKMMLESVQFGRGVGLHIPLGYEDLNEIETWPLLQSFALDSVICPTGFFSSRYVIADITEYIDVMFRAVDGFVVNSVVDVLKSSIIPHMEQFISMFDTASAEQRSRLEIEDAIGPLEMLFDFGELECSFPCDPTKRPVLLIGTDTAKIGSNDVRSVKHRVVGSESLHAVVETCEPSSGLRWCRTYFMQNGKSIPFMPFQGDDDGSSQGESAASIDNMVTKSCERLQRVYFTITAGIRAIVKYSFAHHVDILEAGTYIQKAMEEFMRGREIPDPFNSGYYKELEESCLKYLLTSLITGEWLQLHMDCMNAFGEIVGIEDVDDMGGSCFMYIRASVHGIALPSKCVGTVAVGDTYVFSVNAGHFPANAALEGISPIPSVSFLPHCSDCVCVTHALTYFKTFVGSGVEERSAQRLLSCSRNPHTLPSLGLGKLIDVSGTGLISLSIITDHPMQPFFTSSQVKVFSEGFIIESLENNCLPILISGNIHVEEYWVVSAGDALSQALQLAPNRDNDNLPDFYSPDGNIIVFKLRNFTDSQIGDNEDNNFDDHDKALNRCLHYNPLERVLPTVAPDVSPQLIAFFVQTGSRASQVLSQCTHQWRSVLAANNVKINRGNETPLPDRILSSFLCLLDHWSLNTNDTFKHTVLDERSPLSSDTLVAIATDAGSKASFKQISKSPALGFLPLKCLHSLSESVRMSSSAYFDDTVFKKRKHSVDLVCVAGLPGSGSVIVSSQIYSRLRVASKKQAAVDHIVLDMSRPTSKENVLQYLLKKVRQCPAVTNTNRIVVATVVVSPANHVLFSDMCDFLGKFLSANTTTIISVSTTKSLFPTDHSGARYTDKLGLEVWTSVGLEANQAGLCNLAVLIDDSTKGKAEKQGGLHSWLQTNNPQANSVKLSPIALHLDDEILDDIRMRLVAFNPKAVCNDISAVRITRGSLRVTGIHADINESDLHVLIRTSSQPDAGADAISALQHHMFEAQDCWDIVNLVKVLQIVFPQAVTSSTNIQDTWRVPERSASKNASIWGRLIELAKAKSVASRQAEKGRQLFGKRLTSYLSQNASQVDSLRKGILSIHGCCQIKQGKIIQGSKYEDVEDSSPVLNNRDSSQSTYVYIEANRCAIMVRVLESPDAVSTNASSSLVITGSVKTSDVATMRDMVDLCEKYKLELRPLLSREDFASQHEQKRIQALFQHLPLEGSVWFDGMSYVDIHGNRRELRPDINMILDLYIDQENQKIRKYNELIDDARKSL